MRATYRAADTAGLAPQRRRQAEREVGVTRVSRATAIGASLLLLATIVAVPVVDAVAAERPFVWLAELASGARQAGAAFVEGRPLAANRALLAAIDRAEPALEEGSVLHEVLLPRVQWTLTALLGAGSSDAYPSRDGWLFYRVDVEHLTAPGFLEPRRLAARRLAGDPWQPAPHPDPRPALAALHGELARRGIELLVMPTPVKPAIHPERLAPAVAVRPLRNASWPELLAAMESAGISVFDPAPLLAAAAAQSAEPLYLRADTHWTPRALDLVAEALARRLEPLLADAGAAREWRRRRVTVEGAGDIAAMLPLTAGSRLFLPQRVEADLVVDARSRLWRPDSEAPVLLLGDSFTNVFSDPALGWGSGAGLAEQLAYHLGRGVDRIAQSAGGAHGSREALARDLRRLAGKRVVVYQFATRELSSGDWRPVAWGAAGE